MFMNHLGCPYSLYFMSLVSQAAVSKLMYWFIDLASGEECTRS